MSSAQAQPTGIAQRGSTLVLAFPSTLKTTGVAVSTGSGDRLPASGFAAVAYPLAPHINATDLLLLLILAATAWYGAVRGFVLEIVDLVVLVVGLALAAIASRPLAAVFVSIADSYASAVAIGTGLTVMLVVFAGVFLVRQCLRRMRNMPSLFAPPVNAALGAATGCLRQLPILAMLLAFGTEFAALHWASSSISSSLLGSALIHAWKNVFNA